MSSVYVVNSNKGKTKEGRRITTSEVVSELMTVKLNSPHLNLAVLSSDIRPSFLLRFQILESKTSQLHITHINTHSSK